MKNISKKQKGVLALVMLAFLGTVMGIWVRYLGEHFELYQQVAARTFVGLLLGFVAYTLTKRFRMHAIKQISRKDLIVIVLQSLSLVIGIGLFTASILQTKFANVSFIFSLPMTAFLGIIILKEKLTKTKFILLIAAFGGVALVSIEDFSNLFSWGFGELLAFTATFFYSLSYIMRKWISDRLYNEEIATLATFFAFIFAFTFSQFFGNGILEFTTIPPFLIIISILAGATYISLGYLGSYGFEKVDAIVANNIIVLDSVFGLLLGFLVYAEVPVMKEIIGGTIIVASAVMMDRLVK